MERKARLRNIKYFADKLFKIEEILRCELESANKGCFVLTSTGKLFIFTWIEKKIVYKMIPDISDALWQFGGESELVATCHSGAFLRYTLQHDTGLTCSLQLSAHTFLNLLKSKDPRIVSIKSMKLWGHSKSFILVQPQPDKLVILSTNSGDRPTITEIIQTSPLRSAHLINSHILAQPITGSDIYIYDAYNGKTTEILTIQPARSASYVQWGCLSCSLSTTKFALTDSERRIYLGDTNEKKIISKKGIIRCSLTLHQIVWPASIKPLNLHHLIITFSKESFSLFCMEVKNEQEVSYYLTCDLNEHGILSLIYEFDKETFFMAGLMHELPDLFLMDNGIFMLLQEGSSSSYHAQEMEHIVELLRKAIEDHDLNILANLKTSFEQDFSIFLSLCNHAENWLQLASQHSKKIAEFVDVILSNLTKLSTNPDNKAMALSLKELTKHFCKTMQEDIQNVLNYVDNENVSQLLLQMFEQMNFYSISVDSVIFPEDSTDEKELLGKFKIWDGKPVKEIINNALQQDCVHLAESYLKLKPWIYGEIDSKSIIDFCVEIAKEDASAKFLHKIDKSYCDILKEKLFSSKELCEIELLDTLLEEWNVFSHKERLALHLVKQIYISLPYLTIRPLSFWQDLISYGGVEGQIEPCSKLGCEEITIDAVLKWPELSLMMILSDLFARVEDQEILKMVSPESLWEYLLFRKDKETLQKWILSHLQVETGDISKEEKFEDKPSQSNGSGFTKETGNQSSHTLKTRNSDSYEGTKLLKVSKSEHLSEDAIYAQVDSQGPNYPSDDLSLLSFPLYASDVDSQEPSKILAQDLTLPYIVSDWPHNYFSYLSQSMIDKIPNSSNALANELLSLLSQFGVFISEEKNDPQKMLQRLLSIPTINIRIKECKFNDRVDQDLIDTLILNSFKDLDLFSPLYEHVHCTKLTHLEKKDSWSSQVGNFVDFPEKANLYELCLESLKLMISLHCSDFPQNVEFAALLTMLICPNATLKDFYNFETENLTFNHGESEESDIAKSKSFEIDSLSKILKRINLTPQSLVKKLSQTHTYLEFLFKRHDVSTPKVDVSMYDLLNGNTPFDLDSLFTFQQSNRYGYIKESKICSLLPKDGLCRISRCHLDFCYYLKNGRPIFALVSILKKASLTDSISKPLDLVEELVYGLALSAWPNQRVCSACIALLFMMDGSFGLLRDLIHIANFVVDLWIPDGSSVLSDGCTNLQLSTVTQMIKGILDSICCLSTRRDAIIKLISYFEEATISKVTQQPILTSDRNFALFSSNKPVPTWTKNGILREDEIHLLFSSLQIVYQMASSYRVPLPSLILEFLASNNYWEIFLLGIQLFSYPYIDIVRISQRFSAPEIREHIFYALNNVTSKQMLNDSDSSLCKSNSKARRSLYSKIGIERKQESSPQSELSESSSESLSRTPPSVKTSIEESISTENSSALESDLVYFSSLSYLKDEPLNLLAIFLHCFRKSNPVESLLESSLQMRVPALAVFAHCLGQEERTACLSAWLNGFIRKNCSYDDHFLTIQNSAYSLDETNSFTSNDLMSEPTKKDILNNLITFHMKLSHLDIVRNGLRIFFKENLLLPILDALELTFNGGSVASISNILKSAICNEDQSILSIDEAWLQSLSLDVIKVGIDFYLSNNFQKKLFIQALLPVQDLYPYAHDNFRWDSIYRIKDITLNVQMPFGITEIIKMYQKKSEFELGNSMIDYFVSMHEFELAFNLADLLSLDRSRITCERFKFDFHVETEKIGTSFTLTRKHFERIHYKSVEENISPYKVYQVFEYIGDECPSSSMAFLSYSFAMMWLHEYTTSGDDLIDGPIANWKIEFKLWSSYALCELRKDPFYDELTLLPPKPFEKWPWEITDIKIFDFGLIQQRSFIDLSDCGCNYSLLKLSSSEKEFEDIVDYLINCCLDSDLLVTATRIAKLFSIKNKNVNNLLVIFEKAASIDFSSLTATPSCKSLSGTRNRNISFNSSFNAFLPGKDIEGGEGDEERDGEAGVSISSLLHLTSDVEHGRQLANRLLMLCRLAKALRTSFSTFLSTEFPTKLLKGALSLQCSDGTHIARELIERWPIPFNDVNNLLVEEVLATITAGPGDSDNDYHTSFLSWNDLEERWQELLSLSNDPSFIGQQLLQIGQEFGSSHPDQLQRVHSISVELVIRAHDCFSYAANMEGISTVLQICLTLSKSLLRNRLWQLMVRLVTGIQQYSEMSYIFDILRENEQFENLLGRTCDNKFKNSGLDQALVHYLNSKHPNDKETLKLVSLHFLLYSEIAKMYEEEADSAIERVLKDSLIDLPTLEDSISQRSAVLSLFRKGAADVSETSSTPPSREFYLCENPSKAFDHLFSADTDLLTRAMESYAHAAHYCLQEKKMVKALELSRKAQLVALQVSLVNRAPKGFAVRVLDLSPSVANLLMTQCLTVGEAQLLSRCYDTSVDWPAAIYHHFIKNDDYKYLQSFLQISSLTSDIVLEITKKVEAEQVNEHVHRMAKLLSHIEDIPLVYQVASRLSLRGVIEQCLKSSAMAYLQDTVFTQGYFHS